MATNPRRGGRARFLRFCGPFRAFASLALTLSVVGGSLHGQGERFDPARIDLDTLDPSTLDYAHISTAHVRSLILRAAGESRYKTGLAVIEGKIATLEVSPPATINRQVDLSMFHAHRADFLRQLRRFEEALEELTLAEQLLDEHMATLDPLLAKNKPMWDWSETHRCFLLGIRGMVFLEWGRLDAARTWLERESAAIDALADAGIEVAVIRADSDGRLGRLAQALAAPQRVEELLEQRESAGELLDSERAFLHACFAGARLEEAQRRGGDLAEVRATIEAVLREPGLPQFTRTSAVLWLASVAHHEGRLDEARELLQGLTAEFQGAGGAPSSRRSWVGQRASVARPEERPAMLDEVAREIDLFLAEWHALETREGGYGLLAFTSALDLFAAHTELVLAEPREGARLALETLARAHAESTLARELGAGPPSVAELRAELCPTARAGVLVYQAGSRGSWVFLLDSTTLEVVPLAGRHAVEAVRSRFVSELLASGGELGSEGHLRALSDLLLPREVVARIETWESVAVCGLDLFLGDIPFELLELDEGRSIGAEKAVWRLPPLAASVALARRARAAAPDAPAVRLVAAPRRTFQGDEDEWQEFTLSGEELAAMLAAYPTSGRQALIGVEAHAGALEGVLPPVLQFLVHGLFDETRLYSAQLVLASGKEGDDGLLSPLDIAQSFRAKPAPRLVVLTACRAGRGAQRPGDFGASDLAGAFLAHGSDAVVAGPYDLDLNLATRWSALFHSALLTGADAAEALRRTRVELRRDPAFARSAQPFLLRALGFAPAPFVAPTSSAGRWRSRTTLVASILALALAALLLGRQRLARRRD